VTARCWGVFRERAHSPGRECDDAEILRLTAKCLEERGVEVTLREPAELHDVDAERPRAVFLMCERVEALERLLAWERAGVTQVNRPEAVLDTYRDRMIARFAGARVRFIPSRLVATDGSVADPVEPVWVKRADVHNTQDGDVAFAPDRDAFRQSLAGLAARGIRRAVVQPHLRGDLVKFYGIGDPAEGAAWFRWFYHKGQVLAGHAFAADDLARLARAAAAALGLEVYGGDAIVPADGMPVLLDLNAWPSFALFRDEAAPIIAAHLARRFTGALR
jgi:hypothetical protein